MIISNYQNNVFSNQKLSSVKTSQSFGQAIAIKTSNPKFYAKLDELFGKTNDSYSSTFIDDKDGSIIGIFANKEDSEWLNQLKNKMISSLKKSPVSTLGLNDATHANIDSRAMFIRNNIDKYLPLNINKPIEEKEFATMLKEGKFDIPTMSVIA